MNHKTAISVLSFITLVACSHNISQDESISSVFASGSTGDASNQELREFNPAFTAELFTMILNGDSEGVGKLLSLGADPNGKNSEGTPVLLSALQQNRISIVKILLGHNANANCVDVDLTTPMMQVVSNKNKLIPKTLSDGSVMYVKPEKEFNKYLADLLLGHGADIHAKDTKQETALMRAAALNNVDAVSYLLEKGADPNQKNGEGQTPLMVASKLGHIEVAKSLIKGKADIAATDNEGQTVLIMAAQLGDPEMVRFLISKGALIDAEDVYGATPLKVAQATDHKEVASVILESLKQKDGVEVKPKPAQ